MKETNSPICGPGQCIETGAPAAKLNQVCISYGGRPVLGNVSIDIASCSTTALIGPSGSGKSSLLMALNRMTDLIENCCVTGKIEMLAMNVLDPQLDVVQLRRRVGMIFQRPNPFPVSIWKNFVIPLRHHGVRKKSELEIHVERVLTEVGLWSEVKDRLHHPAYELSGGQQQRLCLARAIALNPEVILLDEPCSALDPISTRTVEELIRELRRKYTVIMVTHNLSQAQRLADQVAVFWPENGVGQLLELGTVEKIFRQPGHPQTAAYIRGELAS